MSLDNGSLGHQRIRTAGIVAVGVALILIVQGVAGVMAAALEASAMGSFPGVLFANLLQVIDAIFIIAFAIGVGLSLWLMAPITRELTPGSAIRRGLLAAAIGAGFVLVVLLCFEWIDSDSGLGALFADSIPGIPWNDIVQAGARSLHQGIGMFIRVAPVVVLVVLLVWVWLTRHPSRHAVSADTAEV